MKLTNTEKILFARLIDEHIETLQCNGCNDLEVNTSEMSKNELLELANEVSEDDDEYQALRKEIQNGTAYFLDWVVLSHLKNKILED